jgi:hypothetical protein
VAAQSRLPEGMTCSKQNQDPDRTDMTLSAISTHDACCSNCRRLLDPLRCWWDDPSWYNGSFSQTGPRWGKERPFSVTLRHLINSASECSFCAICFDELNFEFDFDVDILSNRHLDESKVAFDCRQIFRHLSGPDPKKNIYLRCEMKPTVWSLILPHRQKWDLDVGFNVLWKESACESFYVLIRHNSHLIISSPSSQSCVLERSASH